MVKTEYKFKEIFKLKKMLKKGKIEHEFINRTHKIDKTKYTSYQICCPNDSNRYISVIQSYGSYGREEDLLEIMIGGEVHGYLSAEEVYEIIKIRNNGTKGAGGK